VFPTIARKLHCWRLAFIMQ